MSANNASARAFYIVVHFFAVPWKKMNIGWLIFFSVWAWKPSLRFQLPENSVKSDKLNKLEQFDFISIYEPRRNLRSAITEQLDESTYDLHTYSFRAFSHAVPAMWNSMPLILGFVFYIDSFKSKLKNYLFLKSRTLKKLTVNLISNL